MRGAVNRDFLITVEMGHNSLFLAKNIPEVTPIPISGFLSKSVNGYMQRQSLPQASETMHGKEKSDNKKLWNINDLGR